MNGAVDPSLKSRLIRRLVILQTVVLVLFGLLVQAALYGMGFTNTDESVVEALRQAVHRDAAGRLQLRATREIARMRTQGLWFVIRDERGQTLSEGAVPAPFARIGGALSEVSQAYLGWQMGDPAQPTARLKKVDSAAGRVQILTIGSKTQLSGKEALLGSLLITATVMLPIAAIVALITFFATPWVVRRAFSGLDEVAAQASGLQAGKRGTRLPEAAVPGEVRPLVSAVNDALDRYDAAYDRQKRFLADAAHELRTPIAILSARLESWPSTPERERLSEDVARLSLVAEQLLDLQRLNQRLRDFESVDLVAVARRVAADIAPLAIAGGYELSFESQRNRAIVAGEPLALQRALTNLVHNAIEHGGRKGVIAIRVTEGGAVEVADQGPGVPAAQRLRIFEPFYRLQSLERGAGLGLNLVSEIVRLHRGEIAALETSEGGALFRMTLPLAE